MVFITHKKEENGSITVFLSLILILILSLVMTIIEGARVNTAKVFAERTLTTAMDSVLAEFYKPLMEEYHLLALDSGYGTSSTQEQEIINRVENHMSYTFQPNQGLKDNRMELYQMKTDTMSILNLTRLMDYNGALFINEAVEYEKYRELGDGMELMLNKISLLQEPKKVSYIYEEKAKVEEELVAIDEGVLSLMKLLDGVSTTKKGLKTAKDGSLQTEAYFVKKICYGVSSKEKVGINHDTIFLSLQEKYFDPTEVFQEADDNVTIIENSIQKITEIDKSKLHIEEQLKTEYNKLVDLNSTLAGLTDKKSITEVLEQINACQEEIHWLSDQSHKLQEEVDQHNTRKKTAEQELIGIKSQLHQLVRELMVVMVNAGSSIDQLIEISEKAEPLINNYEDSINKEKGSLGKGVYDGLMEGLKELKRYQTENKEGYNFPGMKEILEHNYSVLSRVDQFLVEVEQALELKNYQKGREIFQEADRVLQSYQIEGLRLDYSSLVIRKNTDMDPTHMIETLLDYGLVSLILDPQMISEDEIKNEMIPSRLVQLSGQGDSDFDFAGLLQDLVIGGKNTGMGNLFSSFGEYNPSTYLGEGINKAAEHLLFQAYLQEHFDHFPTCKEASTSRKPSVLAYEQEYLLEGKTSDKLNLVSTITKVVLLRTILDFTTLLGDKARWTEAKAIAAAMVGFTGLPILVSITQTLLMVLLAFSEALVDTCALLLGKEVPILKRQITMTFQELLQLSRNYIHGKATGYPSQPEGIAFGYVDYLKLFLLFQNKRDIAFRSMDLIQENIRLRYEDSFTFQNCLYGFEAEAKIKIKQKFSSFSFSQEHFKGSSIFEPTIKAAYSY